VSAGPEALVEAVANGPDWLGYAVILAMAAITYVLRAGGLWLAGRVPLTDRVQRFLEYLAGAIMISLVLPLAIRGGPAMSAAVALAAVVVVTTGRGTLAVAAGVLAAAALRQLGVP
jgi:uncharacterized membrane protein